MTGPFDLAGLYQKVWDYTPRPSAAGAKQLADLVQKGTETGSADLRKSIVDLIQANYMLIIDELVKRKKLRKA